MSDKKTKNNNLNDLYETFRKGRCEIVTNLRSHYGDKGVEVVNQVIEAFDKALNATKEDFAELKEEAKRKGKELSPKVKNALTYLDMLLNPDELARELDKDEHKCNCGSECKCKKESGYTCKCKGQVDGCGCGAAKEKEKKTHIDEFSTHVPCDALNEDGLTYSTAMVDQCHRDFLDNKLLFSPLWSACSRRLRQDVAEMEARDEASVTQDDIDELTEVLDAISTDLHDLYNVEGAAKDFCEFIYKRLIEYLDDQHLDMVHTVYPDNDEDPYIAVEVSFDDFPLEIKQRVVDNTDNGKLHNQLAFYLDADPDAVIFEPCLKENKCIVKIYPEYEIGDADFGYDDDDEVD